MLRSDTKYSYLLNSAGTWSPVEAVEAAGSDARSDATIAIDAVGQVNTVLRQQVDTAANSNKSLLGFRRRTNQGWLTFENLGEVSRGVLPAVGIPATGASAAYDLSDRPQVVADSRGRAHIFWSHRFLTSTSLTSNDVDIMHLIRNISTEDSSD